MVILAWWWISFLVCGGLTESLVLRLGRHRPESYFYFDLPRKSLGLLLHATNLGDWATVQWQDRLLRHRRFAFGKIYDDTCDFISELRLAQLAEISRLKEIEFRGRWASLDCENNSDFSWNELFPRHELHDPYSLESLTEADIADTENIVRLLAFFLRRPQFWVSIYWVTHIPPHVLNNPMIKNEIWNMATLPGWPRKELAAYGNIAGLLLGHEHLEQFQQNPGPNLAGGLEMVLRLIRGHLLVRHLRQVESVHYQRANEMRGYFLREAIRWALAHPARAPFLRMMDASLEMVRGGRDRSVEFFSLSLPFLATVGEARVANHVIEALLFLITFGPGCLPSFGSVIVALNLERVSPQLLGSLVQAMKGKPSCAPILKNFGEFWCQDSRLCAEIGDRVPGGLRVLQQRLKDYTPNTPEWYGQGDFRREILKKLNRTVKARRVTLRRAYEMTRLNLLKFFTESADEPGYYEPDASKTPTDGGLRPFWQGIFQVLKFEISRGIQGSVPLATRFLQQALSPDLRHPQPDSPAREQVVQVAHDVFCDWKDGNLCGILPLVIQLAILSPRYLET